MKKVLLMAAVAFCFAACGNSNSNNEAAVETKAAEEHVCNHNHEGEHKCNHAADSTKHECNHNHAADSTATHECNHEEGKEHECDKPADQKCDKCKQAEAEKAAEQAK